LYETNKKNLKSMEFKVNGRQTYNMENYQLRHIVKNGEEGNHDGRDHTGLGQGYW
jgi:hypothetical protein